MFPSGLITIATKPETEEKDKNGRPSWTPLESITSGSRSLSTSDTGYLAALTRRSDHTPGSALPRLAAPRTARCAVLLLLAAGRGSEQGRRWAAPVVLRSLAARSASASGWAAGVGHAVLNGPREERRASGLPSFSERSPTSRRSAALFPPAFGGLRVGARAKRRNAVAAELAASRAATPQGPPLKKRAQAARSERPRRLLSAPLCRS